MSNNVKIIVSALILILIVSMLFLVVPITETFIVSYIFTLIAIIGLAISLCVLSKTNTTKVPQGYSFVYTAFFYATISFIFSIISYVLKISTLWTIVIHIGILGVFIIIAIAISSGSQYINNVNKINEQKHINFSNEKKNYWN